MKLFGIRNLVSHQVSVVEPWAFKNEAFHRYTAKDDFVKYRQQPDTAHCQYSAFEGQDASLRVDKSNPPHLMHGLVVDYDATISDAERDSALSRVKGEFRPIWISRTFSRGARAVWAFAEPVLLPSGAAVKAFLRIVKRKLRAQTLFPGLDEEALLRPETYYEAGVDWRKVSDDSLPRNTVWLWMAESCSSLRLNSEHPSIPIARVADAVKEKFPGQWQGEFEVGARGVRFWDPVADNATAAVVRENGMQCFTGPAAFVPWATIFGSAFVEGHQADRIGRAIASIWFDGRHYWVQGDDNKFVSHGRQDIDLLLRSKMKLRDTAIGDSSCSEAEDALCMIQQRKRVCRAAVAPLRPIGLIEIQGERVLNVAAIQAATPADSVVEWGEQFPWTASFLDGFFEPKEQLEYFLAWLKRYYESGLRQDPLQGQAVYLAGPVDKGKTLLTTVIVSGLMGGHADASGYLTGETRFAGELFAKPVWTMDDAAPLADPKKHRLYSARVKGMVANRYFTVEEKYEKTFAVEWCGRLMITANLDPESIRILPAIDMSNRDKICLFRVGSKGRTFPPDVAAIIRQERPYFARWLLDWEVPTHVVGSVRYGVKAYAEASLQAEARQSSDTAPFEELLAAYLKGLPAGTAEWSGTATDLMRELSQVQGFAPLLHGLTPSRIGRLLAKLDGAGYLRFVRKNSGRVWHLDIKRFWSRDEGDAAE